MEALGVVNAIEAANKAKGNSNVTWKTLASDQLVLIQSASNDLNLPVVLIDNNAATPDEVHRAISAVAKTVIQVQRFGTHNKKPTLMIEFSRIPLNRIS